MRIKVMEAGKVRMEIMDPDRRKTGEPSGDSEFKKGVPPRILELLDQARENKLKKPAIEKLGGKLFSALFDQVLFNEFLNLYDQIREKNAWLRLELDVDEKKLPEVAALPWELMRVTSPRCGTLCLATAPNMIFSRWQARWRVPKPVRLKPGEPLRIAVAVAAPNDLPPVKYEKIIEKLKELKKTHGYEILEEPAANRHSIDILLEKKPHIFHFIGHGRLKDEQGQETGQVALVDPFGNPTWISAVDFGELFNRHQPGLVILQACESGRLSLTRAFVGIASKVIQQNVPAVAVMQFEVTNLAAQRFALEFYDQVAQNKPIDIALQEARRDLALGQSGYSTLDFATPVFFMALEEELLLPGDVLEGLLEKFVDKINELKQDEQERVKKVYYEITRFIQEAKKQGIDDKNRDRVTCIREFVTGRVETEEFIRRWASGGMMPPGDKPTQGLGKTPDYETLAILLKRGELIPFLGPGVLRLAGFPVPTSPGIVKKLSEIAGCRDFNGTLPTLLQVCRSKKKYSREMIIDNLNQLMHQLKKEGASTLLYDILARIEAPLLVISNSYDDLMERAFRQKSKRFALVSHQVGKDSDLGKLQVQYSDQPAPKKLFTDEEISELELLKKQYSIIYKICGHFHLGETNHRGEHTEHDPGRDIPTIFEEEFFTLAKQLEHSIPDHFTSNFPGYGFLFLGYTLEDWQDRLIAYVLLKKWQNHKSSVCICDGNDTNPFEQMLWESLLSVDLFKVELGKFLRKLDKHMKIKN